MDIQCACSRTGEYGRFNELDELVDLDENLDSHFEVGTASGKRCLCIPRRKEDSQDTKEVGRVFICLSKQAKREYGDSVVTPRSI
jgi:hypothetical protein